jgi:hypothetical protein
LTYSIIHCHSLYISLILIFGVRFLFPVSFVSFLLKLEISKEVFQIFSLWEQRLNAFEITVDSKTCEIKKLEVSHYQLIRCHEILPTDVRILLFKIMFTLIVKLRY